MAALVLTAAEQAGIAAGDSVLDQVFLSGMNNPDTTTNTIALQGYNQTKIFGQPPTDFTPQVRGPFRMAWVAFNRSLSSFAETWTEVGSGGSAPAFQNGWANFGVNWTSCAFFKDPFGVVHLKGVVVGTTLSNVFTLPVGYRPPKNCAYAVSASGGFGELLIFSNGNVAPDAGTVTTYLTLDGISFRTS